MKYFGYHLMITFLGHPLTFLAIVLKEGNLSVAYNLLFWGKHSSIVF